MSTPDAYCLTGITLVVLGFHGGYILMVIAFVLVIMDMYHDHQKKKIEELKQQREKQL